MADNITNLFIFLGTASVLASTFNILVIIFSRKSLAVERQLATRPIAKAAIRSLGWLCAFDVFGLVYMTASSWLRVAFDSLIIVHRHAVWVTYLFVGQAVVYYVATIIPAVLLFFIVLAVRDLDAHKRHSWVERFILGSRD